MHKYHRVVGLYETGTRNMNLAFPNNAPVHPHRYKKGGVRLSREAHSTVTEGRLLLECHILEYKVTQFVDNCLSSLCPVELCLDKDQVKPC